MIRKQKLEIFSAIYTQYQVADFSLDILRGLSLKDLLIISTYQEDRQLAFRAAWMFETIILKDKSLLSNEISCTLINNLKGLNNWSCARNYSKVLMYITSPKADNIKITIDQYDIIIEVFFNWLFDPNCPIAVLANGMDILNEISLKYSWIKEQLHTQIEYLLRVNPTPAIKSRGLKILSKK